MAWLHTSSLLFLSSNAQDFIEEPHRAHFDPRKHQFLSSNAQDFIEDRVFAAAGLLATFLSSNAQDFIEERTRRRKPIREPRSFLSSNAQDFIEEWIAVLARLHQILDS